MKFYFIFLVSVLSFILVSGQQETFKDVPDLLQKITEATTDTARILLKCKLAEAYRGNKPDTSLILATESLNESINIKFKRSEIHSLIVLCVKHKKKGDLPY